MPQNKNLDNKLVRDSQGNLKFFTNNKMDKIL